MMWFKNIYVWFIALLVIGTMDAQAQCSALYSTVVNGPTVTINNLSNNYNKLSWDYGDSTTSNTFATTHTHTYMASGTYTICLTVEDTSISCVTSYCDTVVVTVAPPPPPCNAAFTHSVNGASVSFTNNSTSAFSYFWNFGDASPLNYTHSPTHTYSNPGTYTACLYISDSTQSCMDSVCHTITVAVGSCNAQFNYVDTGLTVYFSNSSTPFQPTQWYWDFGDGNTSFQKTPQHTYQSSGTYMICLTVIDTNSLCSDSICKSVTVQAPCNTTASFTHQIQGPSVQFSNTSIADSLALYTWVFGDGTQSSKKHPNHTYSNPGSYIVCLTVVDSAKGCTDTFCDTLVITSGGPCAAGFSYQVSGNSVTFVNTSSPTTRLFDWDFGDQSTSRLKNPQHTYSSPGLYTVCLIAYDSILACVDTICDTVRIHPSNCQASFSIFPDTLTPGRFDFINTSTPSGPSMSYLWLMSDGSVFGTQNVSHTVTSSGTYTMCLTIFDSLTGCSDSICHSFTYTVPTPCGAGFTYVTNGQSVQFVNTSAVTSPGVDWKWDFGDNSIGSNLYNTQHVYASPGTYTVCLILSDSIVNCTDTFCDTVLIQSQPGCLANFSSQDSIGNLVQFFNHSIASSASIGYIWDFGDGTKSWASHPLHLFPKAGAYDVCLTVIDSSSTGYCADSVCQTVYAGTLLSEELINLQKEDLRVYPNPFNQELILELPASGMNHLITNLELYDMTGRTLARFELPNTDQEPQIHLDLTNYAVKPGMYYLQVVLGDQNLVYPVMKK
ncbi:PKD domain-containing protein [bacterium SCSIO 12741]|nr:PKD domain-containing protein [bacterium SCSIO 12741]